MANTVLTIRGRHDLEVRPDGAPPPVLGPDEVLVGVRRLSLCGSDYALFNGTYGGPMRYPLRFGHEWSGTVLEYGGDVTSLAEGDRVTGDCSRWCGLCATCQADRNLCKRIEKYGITVDGFSASMVVVPERYLYRDRFYLPYELLAIAEPFAVALHAIRRLGVPSRNLARSRVLIVGCGPIGVALYVLLTRHLGWDRVDVTDKVEQRVEAVKQLANGQDTRVVILDDDHPTTYAQLYRDSPYSYVLDAGGTRDSLRASMIAAAPAGTVVTLGVTKPGECDLALVTTKALTIRGSIGGTGEFSEVLEFFAEHGDAAGRLITAAFDCSDAQNAFIEGQVPENGLKTQLCFSQ
jgi:L-iditol 2-dehydrogenase